MVMSYNVIMKDFVNENQEVKSYKVTMLCLVSVSLEFSKIE